MFAAVTAVALVVLLVLCVVAACLVGTTLYVVAAGADDHRRGRGSLPVCVGGRARGAWGFWSRLASWDRYTPRRVATATPTVHVGGAGERPRRAPEGHIRVGDAEREQVIARLREAADEGRLTLDELSGRVERAYRCRTHGELAQLVADLP